MLYLDTSALVRLVLDEVESDALSRYLTSSTELTISSALTTVELTRAVTRGRGGRAAPLEVESVLGAVHLVPMDGRVLARAAQLTPAEPRTLDAIHLATAPEAGRGVTVVTYDDRLEGAAQSHGLLVARPS